MNATTTSSDSTTGIPTMDLSRNIDQASAGAHRAIDQASNAARPAVDRVTLGAHEAVDRLAGAVNTASDAIGDRTEQLRQAGNSATRTAREYVTVHPLAAVGIAVATGFLLSRLFSSR